MGKSKRGGVEPTHEWELLVPLFGWPEQERYEEIRPLVLFDASVAEQAEEVGTSKSALYRRLDRFAEEGMEGLFDAGQMRLFRLAEVLGEGGWLKAIRLEDYTARRPRRPPALRQALFPYHEAWG